MYMGTAIPFLGKWGEKVGDPVWIEGYRGKLLEWKIKISWEKLDRRFDPLTGKITRGSGIEADGRYISTYVMRELEECHGR